ncbi:MAG: hypothetical protein L6R38_003993 [Xanthoria sp. 2 TBL-2021]|nr:MAG: hypothetical protein L6R38_003993 [Xanthoria sp. 2 TBL-2021]
MTGSYYSPSIHCAATDLKRGASHVDQAATWVIKQYNSSYYNGPALKVGAGVLGAEALQAAQPAGLRVVGGSCPSVGIAGGYTQGAGHSTLSSQYGLGADQVLEWEVVKANGERVVATPTKNTDLYFALSGDGPVGGALLSFTSQNISKDTYYKAIAAWQSQLPALVDTGATAIYLITAAGFNIAPVTAPDISAAEVTKMLDPYTKTLEALNITYSVNVASEPTYLGHYDKYFGPLPYGSYPTAQLLGGRLVPRSVVETNNDALTGVFRDIAENTPFYIAATALGVKKPTKTKPIADNAILPAWRDALLSVEEEREKQLTTSIIPKLTAVTRNSGTYMNEADFHLASWKQDFYGQNYAKLRAIKTKYDPGNLFYATTAVGSDAWKVADDGRMCRA